MELIEMISRIGMGFGPILSSPETNVPNDAGTITRTISGEGIIGI